MRGTLVFSLLVLAPHCALGTNRYYPDLNARSPNQRFEVTALSPDNQPGHYRAFQRNFTITLRDSEQERLLWTWNDREWLFPIEFHVTDDGYVILRTTSDLLVFSPNGEWTVVGDMLRQIPEAEQSRFTSDSSVGTIWLGGSNIGTAKVDGAEYYYIRTCWGRILAVDIERAQWCSDVSIIEQIEAHVVDAAVRFLRTSAGNEYVTDKGETYLARGILKSLCIAHQYRREEAISIIRWLQSQDDVLWLDRLNSVRPFEHNAEFNVTEVTARSTTPIHTARRSGWRVSPILIVAGVCLLAITLFVASRRLGPSRPTFFKRLLVIPLARAVTGCESDDDPAFWKTFGHVGPNLGAACAVIHVLVMAVFFFAYGQPDFYFRGSDGIWVTLALLCWGGFILGAILGLLHGVLALRSLVVLKRVVEPGPAIRVTLVVACTVAVADGFATFESGRMVLGLAMLPIWHITGFAALLMFSRPTTEAVS